MVNTGRPSKGCLTCRKRRVKCDEVRPVCKRCTKLGAECAWKDDWTQMVRSQTEWAEKKVAQRVEKVQHLRNQRIREEMIMKLESTNCVYPKRATFASQPQIGVEVYAVEHFYSDYSKPRLRYKPEQPWAVYAAGNCPFSNSILPLYTSPNNPNCLHSIVPAVALASAGRQLGRPDLLQEAHRHYGTALSRLGKCLSNPVVAKHDATLLTIFLLELYERISNERHPGAKSPWNAHQTGRHAILRLRGREQLHTPMGRSIFLTFYIQELLAAFCSDAEILPECYTWTIEEFPPSPVASLLLLMHDIHSFLQDVKALFKKNKVQPNEVRRIMRRSAELEEMLIDMRHVFSTGDGMNSDAMRFYAAVASAARSKSQPVSIADFVRGRLESLSPDPQLVDATNESDDDQLPSHTPDECVRRYDDFINLTKPSEHPAATDVQTEEINLHLSITRATATIQTRALHILVLQSMEQVVRLGNLSSPEKPHDDAPKFAETLRAEWHTTIERLATDIVDETPYALGEVDFEGKHLVPKPTGSAFRAYLSLWPLKAALGAHHIPIKLRKRLEEQVKSIYDISGVGIALDLLSPSANLEPEANDVGNER